MAANPIKASPFSDRAQTDQFGADLTRAAGYKPILLSDLKTAYAQYGQAPGQVKGQNQTQLYGRAVDSVLAWWKKQKPGTDPSTGVAPTDLAGTKSPYGTNYPGYVHTNQQAQDWINRAYAAASKTAAGASGGYRPATGAPSGGGYGGGGGTRPAGLPNTAMGRGTGAGLGWTPPPIDAPAAPDDAYVGRALKNYGMTGISVRAVPTYARLNAATLTAWINRVRNNNIAAGQAAARRAAPARAAALGALQNARTNPPAPPAPPRTITQAGRPIPIGLQRAR